MTRREPPPFNPADRTPDPEATSTPRPPAALADMARQIAADYDAKGSQIMEGDGAYGGRLVDELVATLSGLAEELDRYQDATDAPTPPADYRPENPHPGVVVATARTAARSVVEYVAGEGWFPIDGKTDVPDACADATLAALAATGLVLLSETAIERAARELHADNYRNRDARTDSWAAQTWPLLLDEERARWIDKAERVLRAAAGSPQHQPGRSCLACATGQTSRTAHTLALNDADRPELDDPDTARRSPR